MIHVFVAKSLGRGQAAVKAAGIYGPSPKGRGAGAGLKL